MSKPGMQTYKTNNKFRLQHNTPGCLQLWACINEWYVEYRNDYITLDKSMLIYRKFDSMPWLSGIEHAHDINLLAYLQYDFPTHATLF